MERTLIRALAEHECSRKAVLCSQVWREGSVPRKDYPMMLVSRGRIVGTVGGGPVEQRIIERALETLETGTVACESFELNNTDLGAEGGICGGSARFLLEPFTSEASRFWKRLAASLGWLPGRSGEPPDPVMRRILLTRFQADPEPRVLWMLLDEEGQIRETSTPGSSAATGFRDLDSSALAREAIRGSGGLFKEDRAGFTLLRELRPAPLLHIFGAGHVGRATAVLARQLDFELRIYDDRRDLLDAGFFPGLDPDQLREQPLEAEDLAVAPGDCVLIATRDHRQDLATLRLVLQCDPSYVGLVSSRRKRALITRTLLKEGIAEDRLEALHAPVGLDIGAETVPEIALSVLAEIVRHIRRPE